MARPIEEAMRLDTHSRRWPSLAAFVLHGRRQPPRRGAGHGRATHLPPRCCAAGLRAGPRLRAAGGSAARHRRAGSLDARVTAAPATSSPSTPAATTASRSARSSSSAACRRTATGSCRARRRARCAPPAGSASTPWTTRCRWPPFTYACDTDRTWATTSSRSRCPPPCRRGANTAASRRSDNYARILDGHRPPPRRSARATTSSSIAARDQGSCRARSSSSIATSRRRRTSCSSSAKPCRGRAAASVGDAARHLLARRP